VRQAGQDTVEFASQSLLRWIVRLRDDTRFLAYLTPRLLVFGNSPDSPLVDTYASFLLAGGDYHKVRWLDEYGRERLRIDQDGGMVRQVDPEALQDKAARGFFKAGAGLDPGQVHLSALDLNVENGRIELPPRPTLRASSPFLQEDGGVGVVVVNFHGDVLLERLRVQALQSGYDLYLVHPEGYWLVGPEPEDAWGWQTGQPWRTVARFDPALWSAMRKQDRGHWGSWSFATLRSAWRQSEGDLLAHADPQLGQLHLLVRRRDGGEVRWRATLAVLTVLATGLVLAVVLNQARTLAREAAYTRRLRRANQALAEANERLQAAQHELARAQRLSSLGLMVAGVAHEMNTPLASSRLALSTLRNGVAALERQIEEGLRRSELEQFLRDANQACALADAELLRTSALVQRFKQVAVDRASLERRRFDLAEIILDSDPRLRRGEPVDGIALDLQLEGGLGMHTYPGPLEQVVSNLLGNAFVHGYPEGGPGRVTVRALADGPGGVRIDIADEGGGIAAGNLPRIFEPFFTTRRNRGGTGLGLHIVHQIVTEVLGGRIEVHSRQAGDPQGPSGTCFSVHLPRVGPDRPVAPD
jgi:signal transduction histidine kinase